MFKFLMAAVLMGFMGLSTAKAESFDVSNESVQASTQDADLYADFTIDARYQASWLDARTGRSLNGWVPSDRAVCGHANSCSCGGENYCGEYRKGQTAKYWDRGCNERPRLIKCGIR